MPAMWLAAWEIACSDGGKPDEDRISPVVGVLEFVWLPPS